MDLEKQLQVVDGVIASDTEEYKRAIDGIWALDLRQRVFKTPVPPNSFIGRMLSKGTPLSRHRTRNSMYVLLVATITILAMLNQLVPNLSEMIGWKFDEWGKFSEYLVWLHQSFNFLLFWFSAWFLFFQPIPFGVVRS